MRLVAFVHDKRSGVGKLTEEGSATVPFALGSEVEKGTLAVLQRDEPTEIQSTILPLAEVELLAPLAASRFPTRCIRQYHIEGVLVEGDIIATGTPAGVGIGFDPPEYLTDGDQVRIEIEGIGVLTNPVIVNGGGG